jgi:preprotein translocase subunit SecE
VWTVTSQTTTPAKAPVGKGKRPGRLGRVSLFFRETAGEMKKVVYPTRHEIINYTAVVLVFVTAVVLIVSALDYGFTKAVLWVFG